MEKKTIAIAYGDGIGPEIMKATLRILDAAGAALNYEQVKIGQEVYLSGIETGIEPSAWDVLRQHKVFLKSPITTPQGGGYKSMNVTTRKTLGLFANVRPCRAYAPFVPSHFPAMDLVVVRENEEDLYAGIEYQQTNEVVQCLKLISKPACEKIVRYAFEYARAHNRKKVTCMSKDNIMKLTDGLFHKTFDRLAKEYPEIINEHYIIDIGTAMVADQPERFDIIVTLNLYGDIISDVTAQVAGSVGLGGSANIGEEVAMFEAIHGSAPDIAGKGLANPSGLLNAACMMLVHIGQPDIAAKIQNALLKTLEDGFHTGDVASAEYTKERVGTEGFTNALIARLGQLPTQLPAVVPSAEARPIVIPPYVGERFEKQLVGFDLFVEWNEIGRNPNHLGEIISKLDNENVHLKLISNRGVKVYPQGQTSTFCTDHWRCRFIANQEKNANLSYKVVVDMMQQFINIGIPAIKSENLYTANGEKIYIAAQGE